MASPGVSCDRGIGGARLCTSSTPGWLAACALLLLAAGAVTADVSGDGPLRINGVTYLGDLPTLIADEKGLFREHNLDITVDRTTSGSNNIDALRAGDTDLALMALTPFVLEHLRRPDMAGPDTPVILASLVHSTRLNDVIVPAGSAINTPADLAGRRIGLARGTNSEYLWWLFRIYHGLDADAATLVDHPVDTLGEALEADTIDAAVIWEPWTTLIDYGAPARIERLPGADIYTEKWVLVGTHRLVRERPDDVHAILNAYGAAIDWIQAQPEQAFARFAAEVGISETTALGKIDQVLFGLSLDWSLIAEMQQHIEWARATDQDVRVTETDVLSWIAAEPLRTARPRSVAIPRHAAAGVEP